MSQLDEIFVRVTDSGGDGRPMESDPVIRRTVSVRAETDWLIDAFVSLLPPPFSFASRYDATTCLIGSPDLLKMGPVEALQCVENMLRNVTALMHIYSPNTRRSFEVWQVHEVHASGKQSAVKRFMIAINKTDGHTSLSKLIGAESRASLLLRLAETDIRVRDALGLVQSADPGWGVVYDALKFVKSAAVAKDRQSKIRKILGTASHYRHLGEHKRPPLPANSPSLPEAREFAFGLLQEWLDRRAATP